MTLYNKAWDWIVDDWQLRLNWNHQFSNFFKSPVIEHRVWRVQGVGVVGTDCLILYLVTFWFCYYI